MKKKLLVPLLLILCLTGCSASEPRESSVEPSVESSKETNIGLPANEPAVPTEVKEEEPVSSKLEISAIIKESDSDLFGCYNGTNIKAGVPIDVFLNDGWVLGEAHGSTGHISAGVDLTNDQYPGVRLLLSGVGADFDAVTDSDFQAIGYHFILGEGDYPAMTFNGLSWDMTEDDLVAAYGEPSMKPFRVQQTSTSRAMVYSYCFDPATLEFDHNGWLDYTLEFSMAHDDNTGWLTFYFDTATGKLTDAIYNTTQNLYGK